MRALIAVGPTPAKNAWRENCGWTHSGLTVPPIAGATPVTVC